MVHVDVVIIFSIKDPKQFVYRMGAAYFDQLLSAACEEGIRMLVRNCYASSVDKAAKTAAEVAVMGQDGEEGMPKKMDSTKNLDEEEENMPDENRQSVITLKGTRAEKLFTLLNDKFDGCGVHFSDCKVTGVWLPDELSQSLESVTEMRKKFEKQIKGHDFEMMKIQQESEMTLEEIRRKNEQIVVTENGKKKRAEIEREQRVVKSEEHRKVAIIEAEQAASAAKAQSEAALKRQEAEMEKYLVELRAGANTKAQEMSTKADLNYEMGIVDAEAKLQKMLGEAKAVKLDAEAESGAQQHLGAKRQYEISMREKEILAEIARKKQFNLIGTPGDKLIEALMTGNLGTPPVDGKGGGGFFTSMFNR